ncbi:MAG TPA: ABC transporter substrate-binding protein [Fimbriimonas sp.]|nr:ABC transporter substrate-binding protein [Fimbriimonas sp.]
MKLMRKPLLVVLAVLTGLVVGCSKPRQFGGEVRPPESVYAGIASLSPSTTELLGNFMVPMVGRSKACNFPPQVTSVPIAGDLKPNYEMIAKMGRVLIFLDKDLYGDAEIVKLKEVGAVVREMGATNLEEYYKEVHKIGSLCARETQANELVIKVRKQAAVSAGDPITSGKSAVILIPGPGGRHMIAGKNSFQGSCVSMLGLKVIGPDSKRFETANAEFLLAQNPDYILVAGDVKTMKADTRLATLKAIKNNAYFTVPQDIVLRRGGRVEDFLRDSHKGFKLLEGQGK